MPKLKSQNEVDVMQRIDEIIEPEVDAYTEACEKSYKKYGNIFRAEEFLKKKSKFPEEDTGGFWMATALFFIVALAIYGFVDFIVNLLR